MPPNLVGTVLGDRYRLLRVLGEGGMGPSHADIGEGEVTQVWSGH